MARRPFLNSRTGSVIESSSKTVMGHWPIESSNLSLSATQPTKGPALCAVLRPEILEEAEGTVSARMIVVQMVIPNRELLRADERRLLHDKALGEGDAWVDGLLGDRIHDVLHLERDRVGGKYPRKFCVRIYLVAHVSGAVQLVEGLAKDAPWPAALTFQQRSQRSALRLVGALVDQVGCDPASLVNRGWPVGVQADVQVVESQVAVGPLLDVPCPAALALAGGGTPVHVARTPVVAVAGDYDLTLGHPSRCLHGCHGFPPNLTSCPTGSARSRVAPQPARPLR